MSDFNDNQKQFYNPPSAPPAPQNGAPNRAPVPPQAPNVNIPPYPYPEKDFPFEQKVPVRDIPPYGSSNPAPAQTPNVQTPPPAPTDSARFQPYMTQNRQNDIPPYNPQPAQPYPRQAPPQYNYPQPPHNRPYGGPYGAPQTQPMSPGLKALIIIVCSVLGCCFLLLISLVLSNPRRTTVQQTAGTSASASEIATVPEMPRTPGNFYEEYEDEDIPSAGNYKESDAKNKTEKDFKGITLNKKPKKASSDKTGSAYAFSSTEKSVVGVICYVDGEQGTATSYTSMGTGIVITENGYIMTNSHIIDNSRTAYKLKIITNDKKEYKAGVVGYDSRSDLAVLKIDAEGLVPATFGDSSETQVTEDVIVIGNPLSLNYQNSVTKGIVSAVGRQVSLMNNVRYIQTDAAVNPGNSGGPVCNMYGQVIGITNSKIALDDYEGMGFAIPSAKAKSIADDIIRYGYVKNRVKIGIMGKITAYGDEKSGIEIQQIITDGPMDGVGAKVGDIVTKVGGEKVSSFAEIYDVLEKYSAGDEVKITLYRPDDNKSYDVTVKLQEDKN